MTDESCCKKGFFASAADSAKRLVQDPRLAPANIVEDRMAICSSCEWNNDGICGQCGCVLQAKTRFRNMKCPVDKWVEAE